MEDFKFIFYIVLAVAYFLFTNWRKFMKGIDEEPKKFRDPDAGPEQPQPKPQQQHRPSAPSTSFGDILRELQPKVERARERAKTTVETATAQIPTPPLVEKPKYRNYEAEYAVKSQSYTDERLAEAREISRRTQEVRRKEAFVPYAQIAKKEQSGKIAVELLRNPTTAREAFILSEIFQRRY